MADIRILAAMLTALLLGSSFLAVVVSDKEKGHVETFNILETPLVESENQDYTSSSGYNTSIINGIGDQWTIGGGTWEQQTGIGLTLISNSIYGSGFIYFSRVSPDEKGLYDVTYHINNSVNSLFSVYPHLSGRNAGNVELIFKSTGIYVPPDNLLLEGFIIPIFGYRSSFLTQLNTDSSNIKIRTVYDPKNELVDVYYNDVYMTRFTNFTTVYGETAPFFAGVKSDKPGFTLIGLDAKITQIPTFNNAISSIIDSTLNYLGLSSVKQFITTLMTILVWNVEEQYLPWVFNLIFVKVPEMIVLAYAVQVIRGN